MKLDEEEIYRQQQSFCFTSTIFLLFFSISFFYLKFKMTTDNFFFNTILSTESFLHMCYYFV
jgi:hypothetical protein